VRWPGTALVVTYDFRTLRNEMPIGIPDQCQNSEMTTKAVPGQARLPHSKGSAILLALRESPVHMQPL
jgi:hypothetical protein